MNKNEPLPTRRQAAIFVAKAWVHRTRRALRDLRKRPPLLEKRAIASGAKPVAESVTPLFSSTLAAEFALQAGKVQNLRVAARHLHGLVLPAGRTFSFWRNVPRPAAWRGYAPGRELREGCVIPSVGGGLCQLSNAIFDCALQAGCEIVERHAHSRRLPGSAAERGRDATVFWNYVDLRFRAEEELQFDVSLAHGRLCVRLLSTSAVRKRAASPAPAPSDVESAESCETCGVTDCFRNSSATSLPCDAGTAWLLDAFWPEHDAFLRARRTERDHLFIPLDGARWRIGPYRWGSAGFARVHHAPWLVLRRSLASRRLAAEGAARQRALLGFDAALARSFSKRLPFTHTHLVVSQNLLPFLWRDGVLHGRTFDVLMTRLPLAELHSTLDQAAARWPGERMLTDFRADPALIADEQAALREARHWITPHDAMAKLAGTRVVKLPWSLPVLPTRFPGRRIVFPSSTLARKGAWEVRAVARETLWPLSPPAVARGRGSFWAGCNIAPAQTDWLTDAAAVVLPAWVENQPRRLLRAIAAGVPVVATAACGLGGMNGVTLVPPGDPAALKDALARILCTGDPADPARVAEMSA